ncbi:receptor-type tyrosine-protein phosphatase N2 isoform X2 [Phlebotomus papatasi]|uniref:receptor-type tyrosine-protein phosphatase N2 isoform X2 n=1 Tax=Phlebotomus papatasi TaxID=29031 RepID=UPI0024840C22|nr:receptor-type tyrosine-protein phosphatase N2 isoform X2 [Phlebotomus papatasi]
MKMVKYGRKKWTILWTGIIFVIHLNFYCAVADRNIGCLFAESLCEEQLEWCYDDFAFGVCLPKYGVQPEQMTRQPLSGEHSGLLATMLEELEGAGLTWEHPFVQCRIQGALYALRNDAPMPHNLCAGLTPDPQILDPQSPLAFVRFSPPTETFADEVYIPPPKKSAPSRNQLDYYRQLDTPSFESEKRKKTTPAIDPRVVDELSEEILRELMEEEQERLEAAQNTRHRAQNHENPLENIHRSHFKENDDVLKEELLNELEQGERVNQYNEMPTTSFREVAMNRNIPEVYFYSRTRPYEGSNELPQEVYFGQESQPLEHFRSNTYGEGDVSDVNRKTLPAKESGVYTEGGVVYLPDRGNQEQSDGEDKEQTRNMLANMLGFTRHERLDVKKPGPPAAPPPSSQSPHEPPKLPVAQGNKEVLPAHFMMEETPKIKKVLHDGNDDDHGPHSVDMEYAHVILKTPIDSWRDGSRIVTALSEMLHMQGYFTYPRIDRHEVSFRVEPNPEKKTAADIARAINDSRVRNNLSRRLGVVVVRAGVGDKTKKDPYGAVTSSKVLVKEEGPDVTHVMAYMFAGAGAAAVIVIIITLFLIKRHDRKRDKLSGINSGLPPDSCSKDYQELCRARMAGKGGNEGGNGGRITSLSKENEGRPPSSRSSTSSWSEEPVTNMDISTGHMVLSYMEDHLRNKGRLQREWEALCRYEAEPNAREAALQKQCTLFNRTGAPLPFDHSRVVLNHLSNADGLDYINASTITDHDPRAPAYVAAQGPIQATISHFWQMIWEQGAVVIVALCRLQENGEASCARYWPEEGAQVYHIYEVHLVSEHIWCDDYLVRSFYLKNLQTGETRTVTQFHFLSWPQTGIPTSAKALLDFRRKVNKSYRGRSCPIVVHSSNGAGRTGAYILLDLVLARMNKGAREIDIAATLEHLRDQRAGLVATRQQFEFVLMAVAEEVHAILKALPTANAQDKRDIEKDVLKEHPDIEPKEEKSKASEAAEKKSEKK